MRLKVERKVANIYVKMNANIKKCIEELESSSWENLQLVMANSEGEREGQRMTGLQSWAVKRRVGPLVGKQK